MANQLNILVTGGAGFLGSHLCEKLLNDNHKVFCVDNFYSSNKINIKNLINHPNFKFLNQDVCQLKIDFSIDQIYNLACPASPIHYQHDPVKTIQTNVLGSVNVLELAKKNNALILQASTSEVYGDPVVNPQNENYWGNVNPIGVRACYDEGKRAAETLFFDYHRQYQQKIKVARIFNTYGPKMQKNDGRVISNFIIQALNNKPLTIYGDGSQTRSFCYVDDLITGLIKFMNETEDFTGPLNLGNDLELSISEIANKVIQLSSSNSSIKYLDSLPDDPIQRRPDLSLANQTIGWNPSTKIDEGILLTIEYFKTII